MTKLLQKALEKLSALPDERQDELAQMLIEVAQQDIEPYEFTQNERVALEHSLAQAERGKFASDEEVAAMWKSFEL